MHGQSLCLLGSASHDSLYTKTERPSASMPCKLLGLCMLERDMHTGSSYCCQGGIAYMLASPRLMTPQELCLRVAALKAGSARHLLCPCWSRGAQNQHQRAQLLLRGPAPRSIAQTSRSLLNVCSTFMLWRQRLLPIKRAMPTT